MTDPVSHSADPLTEEALRSAKDLALTLGVPPEFVLRGAAALRDGRNGRPAGNGDDGAAILLRQLAEALESRARGAWKPIPEEIWLDTLKCYPRFVSEHRRSYGRDGFDRYRWTVRQAAAKLFRVGELEYELDRLAPEEKAVSLHIPSDARLEPDRLNVSLRMADSFLRTYFPDWADKKRICESWLLSPKLRDLLPPSSRILRFQRAFDPVETDPEDDSALEWVFYVAGGQREGLDVRTLPEVTALQKSMKALLLSGEKPGSARGVLARPF